ncbi:cytochrome c3 family protein [Campylobacter mucosalis]|uniref:cytochrome c3 family protein n=1 Tax=Campylobacter mucosalis TaxID=202 RepID=UPI00147083DD|nr:NapC/NirT family cytochrome c [Campylobacter mucosalis]
MDGGNAVKKKIAILIFIIGGIIGFFMVLPVRYALEETSGEKFCVVCHEMDPMVISYTKDVHSGIGKTGVRAKCVDCHLPHDNLAKYVYQKAKNGVIEGYIHFFGEPENIDWVKNRKNNTHYVFDNGCTSCHANVLDNKELSEQAQKMHAHYAKLLGTDKEIKCVSCHNSVGHAGELRNYLEYWKPTYKIYENKMLEKKIEQKRKYFGDEYTPNKSEQEFINSKANKPASTH